VLLGVILFACAVGLANERLTFKVTPADLGQQLIRSSLPLPRGFLGTNQALVVAPAGGSFQRVGLRVLSWHPADNGEPRYARRALVTFPYEFADLKPVDFIAETARNRTDKPGEFAAALRLNGESFSLEWKDGRRIEIKLIAPEHISTTPSHMEVVEANRFFQWQRFHYPDPQWPRIIEFRLDAAGGVVAVAHWQRANTNGNFAPELGWEISTSERGIALRSADTLKLAIKKPLSYSFAEGASAEYLLADQFSIYHPTAPLKRRGEVEILPDEHDGWTYRYLRGKAEDKIPMQPWSWQRAELVIAPRRLARLTSALISPHRVEVVPATWPALYGNHESRTNLPSLLEGIARYHRDAIIRSAAVGDDFGNVTSYNESSQHGDTFGMNRLNHGAAIFEGGWRDTDGRLTETALVWCDNFFDQSIWWGEPQRGGTRYNNIVAMKKSPPTPDYMWRSDSSVTFCTKGYDCFWLAWEETGDPRMMEAFQAQITYAGEHVHANTGECRNIGDARDFIQLYGYTGQANYLEEALRLFRELRTKLSTNHLFDQGGKPIDPDPPFIEEDQAGLKVGYAKPYIIGYALAGLPELIQYATNEPELKETVRAVADFLASTVDPAGGWRYPHPRSSHVIIGQGLEHAWQLTQAARALGPDSKWLDAIETVLRARILAWRRSGKILSGLEGWEVSTGKVKNTMELYDLYKKPSDRNASRDYREGRLSYGSSPPEGIVYFEEVLGFYLQHRPTARLLAEPKPDEPLGQILARLPEQKK